MSTKRRVIRPSFTSHINKIVDGKRGKKSMLDEKLAKEIIELHAAGHTTEEVANMVGVGYSTIRYWMRNDATFRAFIKQAREIVNERVEKALYLRALGYSHPEEKIIVNRGEVLKETTEKHYPPETQAIQWWLKYRSPSKWGEKSSGIELEPSAIKELGLQCDDEPETEIEDLIQYEVKYPEKPKRGRGRPRKNPTEMP